MSIIVYKLKLQNVVFCKGTEKNIIKPIDTLIHSDSMILYLTCWYIWYDFDLINVMQTNYLRECQHRPFQRGSK